MAARAHTRGAGRVPNPLGRIGEGGNTIILFAGGVRHAARIGEMKAPLKNRMKKPAIRSIRASPTGAHPREVSP
ncbi:MAG: hypothetical protein NT090_14865 [Acidobacteria bacterium]|nr:hypothetical protein [Acidobacteriota bacterium]